MSDGWRFSPPVAQSGHEPSWLRRVWNSDIGWSFRHSPVAIVSAIVSIVMILAAILAPLFAPQDPFNPAVLNLMEGLTPPGTPNEFTQKSFVFGSDSQGRDMFSAVLYGTQVSLLVGAASVLFSAVFGVLLGLMAGYIGGKTESIIMRIADIQLSFPAILIALLIFGVARGLIRPASRRMRPSSC